MTTTTTINRPKDISDFRVLHGPEGFRSTIEAQCETIEQEAPPPGPRALPPILWADDFLAKAEPEPQEIVKGMLHAGCKMVLGGSSKSNKTWTLLDLALSVANGREWLGFETAAVPVMYCNFEVQAPFFDSRLRHIMKAKELTAAGPVALWNLRGHSTDLARLSGEIAAKAEQEGIRLLIIDPLYKLLGGRNENESAAMAELMNEIERIAVESDAAVAFGAHFSKGNQASKESIDRISGSGVFARDPDSILTMTAHEEPNAFTVEPILRNHAPVEPFTIRWEFPLMQRDGGLDPKRLKKAKGAAGRLYDEAAVLAPLGGGKELTTGEWQKALEEETGMSRRTFYNLKEALTKQGKVRLSAISGKWVTS